VTNTAARLNTRILKNSAALLASQIYIALTALVLATQLPRYLGENGYGLYSEIYAFVGMFEVIGQLGLRVILTREIARYRERALSLLGQVLPLKLPLAAAAFAIIMLATLLRPTTPFERFLVAICITESLIRGYSNTINGALRAFELMHYNLVIVLIDRTLAVGAVLAAVYLRLDVTAIFIAYLVSGVGRLLAAALLCWWKLGFPKWGANLPQWKWFLREAWPVGLSNAITRTYDGIGIVLLGTAGGATGQFSGAMRIITLISMIGVSITDALFPLLSRASHSSPQRLSSIAQNGLSLLMALVFPIAAFSAMFGQEFVPWFLGNEFSSAASALLVLTPAMVLQFTRTYFSSLLSASDHQRVDTLAILLALGTNIAGNLILIPRLDFLGAAWALLISETTYILTIFLFPKRSLPVSSVGKAMLPAIVGAIGCVAIWLLAAKISLWIRLPLGGILYGVIWLSIARNNAELWHFLLGLFEDIQNKAKALLNTLSRSNRGR
jgi:O-antigen/teichoic acid export membrane protein